MVWKSIFQNDEYVILGAECKFKKQDEETSKQIIKNATLALRGKQYLDSYGVERAAVPEVLQLNEGGNNEC